MSCNNPSQNPNAEEVLEQAIAEPSSVTGDQGSWTNRSLGDIIAADAYLQKRKKNRRQKVSGLYGSRLQPPNARGY